MHDEPQTKEEVPRLGFEPGRNGADGTLLGQQMRDDARGIVRHPVDQE